MPPAGPGPGPSGGGAGGNAPPGRPGEPPPAPVDNPKPDGGGGAGGGGAGGTGGSAGSGGSGGGGGGAPPAGDAGGGSTDGGAPANPAPPGADPSDKIFSTDVLHEIKIVVDPQYMNRFTGMGPPPPNEMRVPCTFTFDDITVQNVGIRRKGGVGSYILGGFQKPPYSIKFDEFVPGQEMAGVDKLLLNSANQDMAFLNEHVGYEIFRRAKMPAARTAHAVLSFNGQVKGIYVIKEAFDKKFLSRHFGKGNNMGNLYEGPCPPPGDSCVDFVTRPADMEVKVGNRMDLNAAAAAARMTGPMWPTLVGEKVDLDSFVRFYALEGLVEHWDGYSYEANNYLMYNNPMNGKFYFIVHGGDAFMGTGAYRVQGFTPDVPNPNASTGARGPGAVLASRIWMYPDLVAKYKAALRDVLATAWDVPALMKRIDDVRKLLQSSTRTEEAFVRDRDRFNMRAPTVERFIMGRKSFQVQ
jgi:spore coat protein H